MMKTTLNQEYNNPRLDAIREECLENLCLAYVAFINFRKIHAKDVEEKQQLLINS